MGHVEHAVTCQRFAVILLRFSLRYAGSITPEQLMVLFSRPGL